MILDVRVDEFHVLNLCGMLFYVDKATRREIEHFLASAEKPWETLTVEDLAGVEVLVVVDGVNAIWSSTPEQREADRAMRKALETEEL